MAEFVLKAEPPLAGYDTLFGATKVFAPKDLALVSIALPLGGETDAMSNIHSAYGSALPDVGKSVETVKGNATLLRLAADQAFVLFQHASPNAEQVVADLLKSTAYVTDQTDVWCALDITGPEAVSALERICPIDLHLDTFHIGDFARTMMEHLGVIILRRSETHFLLLSASSSAGSFLHAIETSLHNVT